jgi:transposase
VRLSLAYPIIPYLLTLMIAFNEALVSADVKKLADFINTYQNDSIEAIATFASGLGKDNQAVMNNLLYPEISNGPIEGVNNKIKMMRRRGYGRAGLEFVNAISVLPWYYKDIDENSETHKKPAA